MRKVATFLILFLLICTVEIMAEEPVATIHIISGQSTTAQLPHATVEYYGEFWWINGEICAPIHVIYDNGGDHGVCARPSGETDPEKLYEFKLENIEFDTWHQIQELKAGDTDAESTFKVDNVDPLLGTVRLYLLHEDRTVTLSVGDSITAKGVPQATIKLIDINIGLFSTTVKFNVTYKTPIEADIVVYHYQAQGTPGATPNENQTNESPKIPPLNISTPIAMIVVGEHAAGADVAAGAKVGIAVQKWIDILKDRTAGEAARGFLGPLGPAIIKTTMAPIQNLNADAMLDTEVKDPDTIAPVVYTVGGPAANEYTKTILEKNANRLPVKFVKENGKWYLVSRYGDKWDGSYGIILTIPTAKDAFEFQQRRIEGKIKVADIVVAGLDRWGTYAACELLQGEFMKPILGEKPRPELEYLIELQGRALMLFSQNPLEAFTITIDPNNPFKLQPIAIIVDKNGQIVKVLVG